MAVTSEQASALLVEAMQAQTSATLASDIAA